jgi:dolichol-phosphate mannosyltransferase
MSKTIIVIPTYNEVDNLPRMIPALLELPIDDMGILVVDDGSPDGTGQKADDFAAEFPGQVNVLHRKEKSGLGPAYIAGFKRAMELGADYIVQMDCDFSHQPKYVPELVNKINEGYDLVVASRWMKGGGVDEKWGIRRKLLSWWANRVYVPTILRLPVHDATAGFKIWRRETLIGLDLDRIRSNGYVFQVEMSYVAWRLGFKLGEIPIHFPDRQIGESKMDPKIASEAAIRTWQILYRHRSLNPTMRRVDAYTTPGSTD